jgi:hypothetical protein
MPGKGNSAMQQRPKIWAGVVSLALIIFIFVPLANGAIHILALTGAQATDEAAGATFTNFGTPSLNNLGTAAFLATVTGPGVATGQETGIWSGNTTAIARTVRAGTPVPGDPSAYFSGFNNPTLDGANQTATVVQLTFTAGTPTPEVVAASGPPGAFAPLYRRGDAAPGLGGPTFNASAITFVHNVSGQSAFIASVSGAGVSLANDLVIYAQDAAGDLRLVAREGNAASGTGAGVVFGTLSDFAMNRAGQVAFQSSLSGTGVGTTNNRGIWSEGGGSLHLVARLGSQAPGAPAGANFTSVLATGLQTNDLGHVAFIGFSQHIGGGSDDQGVWSDRTGVLAPVVFDGQAAPGIGGGVTIGAMREAILNGVDKAAYIASVEGPGVTSNNTYGVWSEANGGPRLVARQGNVAPGVTDGAAFKFFEALAMNRQGQAAFYGTLMGTGVTTTNDNGLWAEDANGALRLLVREGGLIQIGPSDTRTVSGLSFIGNSAGQDGRRSAFNDRGELAALARFTDGSGAILLWDDTFNLPGDFNHDRTVDTADYVAWRKTDGTPTGYDSWRSHFGDTAGAGSSALTNAAIPEPAAIVTLTMGTLVTCFRRRGELAP